MCAGQGEAVPGPPQLKVWTGEGGPRTPGMCPAAEPGLSAWLEPVPTPPRNAHTHTSGREVADGQGRALR